MSNKTIRVIVDEVDLDEVVDEIQELLNNIGIMAEIEQAHIERHLTEYDKQKGADRG